MFTSTLRVRISDRLERPLVLIRKVQKFLIVVILHKILIPVVLTATYFIVFGLGSLIARIFARGIFRPQRMKGSYWVEATGYEADTRRSLQQS